MKYFVVVAAILLACCMTGCSADEPSILVKLHFKVSWREMCQLENYLKENLARQIVAGKDGATLDTHKVVLYNFAENCQPKGGYKEAVVSVYVSKVSGSSDFANIDVEMTKKLYKVLDYMVEHKQERYLGNLFDGKIESVDVTGKDAPVKSTAYTEIERLYIGMGVALAIIVVIIIILVAVSCCRNRNKPEGKVDRSAARAHYNKDDEATIRTYPATASASENPAYTTEDEKGQYYNKNYPYPMSTRF